MNEFIAILIIAATVGMGSAQVIESPQPMSLKACLAETARAAPLKAAEGFTVLGGGCVTRDALPYLKKALQ